MGILCGVYATTSDPRVHPYRSTFLTHFPTDSVVAAVIELCGQPIAGF